MQRLSSPIPDWGARSIGPSPLPSRGCLRGKAPRRSRGFSKALRDDVEAACAHIRELWKSFTTKEPHNCSDSANLMVHANVLTSLVNVIILSPLFVTLAGHVAVKNLAMISSGSQDEASKPSATLNPARR
jgi:hypothetical protein